MLEQKSINKLFQRKKQWFILLFWFSFFMAFPSIVILGQNISVFIFGTMIVFLLRNSKASLLNLRKWLQWLAFLFGTSAILSVANIPSDAASDSFERALAVLPNYLYWSLLIILLVTHRRAINLDTVYKGIFWGVVVTVGYYLFLQNTLGVLPSITKQSPNIFSFILICYAPIAVYYLWKTKGKSWAIALLLTLVLVLLRDGRRAGMVLVLLGGLAVLYASQINWKNVLAIVVIVPLLAAGVNSKPVESFIFNSSERIHGMIYATDKIRKTDISYLTRIAMVKKGLAIFEKYRYTGIGLNNFSNYSIDFDKYFEGAKYVVHKENLQIKSAHNSYISILAEGGLFLFLPFVLILVTCLFYFLSHYFSISEVYRPVFIGIAAMSVHLYLISAILNVFAWFLIALACSLVYRK